MLNLSKKIIERLKLSSFRQLLLMGNERKNQMWIIYQLAASADCGASSDPDHKLPYDNTDYKYKNGYQNTRDIQCMKGVSPAVKCTRH